MANGNFGGGNGTTATPYLIEDADDLNAMRKNLDASYKLVNDINLGVAPYCEGEGWNPIDNFTGQLDGNRHSVFNLYINRRLRDNVGFFGYLTMPKTRLLFRVYDIAFENVDITGKTNVGGIVGAIAVTGGEAVDLPTVIFRTSCSGKVNAVSWAAGMVGYSCVDAFGGNTDSWLNGGQYWEDSRRWVIIDNCISKCTLYSINAGEAGGFVGNGQNRRWEWGAAYDMHYCAQITSVTNSLSYCSMGFADGSNAGWNIGNINSNIRGAQSNSANSYHDSTLAPNARLSTGSQTLTSNDFLNLSVLTSSYWLTIEDGRGNKIFKIEQGKYPCLSFVNQNHFLVKIKDDYFSYDSESKSWAKRFSGEIPKTAEATKYAMADLDELDIKVWDKLKKFGKIEIINILPQTNIIMSKRSGDSIPLDEEISSKSNNLVFRKEYSFESLEDKLINISPV